MCQHPVVSEECEGDERETKVATLPVSRALTVHQFYHLFVYVVDNYPLLQQAKARLHRLQQPPPPRIAQQPAPPVNGAAPPATAASAQLSSSSSSASTSSPSPSPSSSAAADDDDCRTCSICLSKSVEVALPCLHAFCAACIEDWHRHDTSCPLCRHASNVATSDVWIMDSGSEDELREQIALIARFPHNFLANMPEFMG